MKLSTLFGRGLRTGESADATSSPQPSARVRLAREWLDVVEQTLADAVRDNPAKHSEGWFISTNSELAHAARGGDARLGQPSLRGTTAYEKQQQRKREEDASRPVVTVGAAGSTEYGVDPIDSITPDNVGNSIQRAAKGLLKAGQVGAIPALQHLVANVQRQTR